MSEFEYCDRGSCAAQKGHEGTCAEASGWADEPSQTQVNLLAALDAAVKRARADRKRTAPAPHADRATDPRPTDQIEEGRAMSEHAAENVALTDADVEAMRAAHRDSYPMGNIHHGTPERPDWGTFCVECKESWPCEVARLIEHFAPLATPPNHAAAAQEGEGR